MYVLVIKIKKIITVTIMIVINISIVPIQICSKYLTKAKELKWTELRWSVDYAYEQSVLDVDNQVTSPWM